MTTDLQLPVRASFGQQVKALRTVFGEKYAINVLRFDQREPRVEAVALRETPEDPELYCVISTDPAEIWRELRHETPSPDTGFSTGITVLARVRDALASRPHLKGLPNDF